MQTLVILVKYEYLKPLIDHGHSHFGENKVQEAEEKWTEIKKENLNLKIHMIGKLQSNKAKKAVQLFDFIHSLDSKKLADALKKRENDLIAGTFGRGIYILDDYSCLREFSELNEQEAQLFTPRDAYWYIQKRVLGRSKKAAQGDNYFVADNPPFGVEFTYYLKEKYQSKKDIRVKKEKQEEKKEIEVGVPNWEVLEAEKKEILPSVWLFIYSEKNQIVKKVKAKNLEGLNRVVWDLTSESTNTINEDNLDRSASGPLVNPQKYLAQLHKQTDGKFTAITDKVKFEIKPLMQGALKGSSSEETVRFWEEVVKLRGKTSELSDKVSDINNQINMMLLAYARAKLEDKSLHDNLLNLRHFFK